MPHVTIGVQVIPQHGDFEAMKRAWLGADELGADRIYNWDHFFPLSGDSNGKHFESLTIQAAMAALTKRAEISSLVICNSYRNPSLLADMARTIDHISGGRFVLGIIKARWELLNPPPLRRIPILIGGGGEKVTLRIVAEHADIWHAFGDPATLRRKSDILDDWCVQVGRDPAEIQRSTTVSRLTGERQDPSRLLELGFTDFIVSIQGPDWDIAPLERLLAWRDGLG
jgi:alkanesulfonate monooxygenase SsuD/methylene tetrahydromethanopterin reductase-like flavin-dependent oxidoreductase (luciferase family)